MNIQHLMYKNCLYENCTCTLFICYQIPRFTRFMQNYVYPNMFTTWYLKADENKYFIRSVSNAYYYFMYLIASR